MKKREESNVWVQKNHVFATLSVLLYLSVRFLLREMAKQKGWFVGGPISYDSYYQMSFANELQRTGQILFFHNPFGTLDSSPYLINLYASILSFAGDLYRVYPFYFDLILGSCSLYLCSFFLATIFKELSFLELFFVFFGGGVGYLLSKAGVLSPTVVLGTGYWGLNYALNQIATPEIVYHSLFFFGLYLYFERKFSFLIGLVFFLGFLHPFTSLSFHIPLIIGFCVESVRRKSFTHEESPLFIAVICSTLLTLFLFVYWLPSVSKDASYIQKSYQNNHFHIQPFVYFSFLLPPMLYFLYSFFLAPKDIFKDLPKKFWVFLGTGSFCVAASMSFLVSESVVQPIHWSRVYPYVFFIASASLLRQDRSYKWPLQILPLLLLSVAFIDNARALNVHTKHLIQTPTPPHLLTEDQFRMIEHLRTHPPKRLLMIRDCQPREFGNFEYSLSAITKHQILHGHVYFSPFRRYLFSQTVVCSQPWKPSLRLMKKSQLILMPQTLATDLHLDPQEALFRVNTLLLFPSKYIVDSFTI